MTKREKRLCKRISTTAIAVRSLEHKQMVVRFVAPGELLPDALGRQTTVASAETLQFYELGPQLPRSEDPHGRPHVRLEVATFPASRLKNGCLNLVAGRRRKLSARKLEVEDVERILNWLPDARRLAQSRRCEALYQERRCLREERQRRRAEILARWHLRGAEHFRPQISARSRLSPLVGRSLCPA